jgi:hypothetical protein
VEATPEAVHERVPGDRRGRENQPIDNVPEVLAEEAAESRWEAAPAVLVVIGLQLTLALVSRELDWKLWRLPW